MKIPALKGIIRRRILLNYVVDPTVVAKTLPKPFRPKLVGGKAVAGICLIRLERIRPKGVPGFIGTTSENSAHRIAVTWDDDGSEFEGVFVPRRHGFTAQRVGWRTGLSRCSSPFDVYG
ncbi:MAG: DUF2071 domain-containing protein [Verrucomicrobiota bacterium]